ncbi:MAG: hypothetical protein LC768_17920 [Acidobacteria bacterium]|nr:hypothetical protein [Acidobacteriota bacterium]MCA1640170.1 hypothetical protein [Acidobacteriota bacterium]
MNRIFQRQSFTSMPFLSRLFFLVAGMDVTILRSSDRGTTTSQFGQNGGFPIANFDTH